MSDRQGPTQNKLLGSISSEAQDRLFPDLEWISLSLGQVLYEADVEMDYIYFPVDALVALLYVFEDGTSAEMSVVGKEGAIGISLFMGGNSTPSRGVVQCAGHAYRLPASALESEFAWPESNMRAVLLVYIQMLLAQMTHTAACNRHHSTENQLCRWLLLSLDRLPGNKLIMNQELIASMLGVRWKAAITAIDHLHDAGIVDYSNGIITVLDRPKLEQVSCECYAVVKKETDRLLALPGD